MSPPTRSGPPHASSWAGEPPEFYLDENSAGKSVRRCLTDLGYRVHTPGELYETWAQARGQRDEDWLPLVGERGWAVIGSDLKIFERPEELHAYRQAKVSAFLLPGESRVAQRLALLDVCLADMCTVCMSREVGVWRLTLKGIELYGLPKSGRRGRSRQEGRAR